MQTLSDLKELREALTIRLSRTAGHRRRLKIRAEIFKVEQAIKDEEQRL
jgi:hypothetical protein